jgi:hypothetical protein
MSEIPGVPKKYLNAFSAKDGRIVSTGQYGFEVPGVPEEYFTCFNVYDTDQEMADPTTIETEIVNPDLFDIANMEWEEYIPGESSKNTNTAEEAPIKQLMNFQH